MRKRLSICAVLVLIPIVLGACGGGGGGSKVSASNYVNGICTNIRSWVEQVRQRQTDLQSQLTPGISPQQGQDLLRGFFDKVISDTENAVNGVRNIGIPDVPNGGTIASVFVSALDRAKTALETARGGVDSLPTNNPTAFKQAADQLGSEVKGSLNGIGSAFNGLKSSQLDQAAKTASACQGGL